MLKLEIATFFIWSMQNHILCILLDRPTQSSKFRTDNISLHQHDELELFSTFVVDYQGSMT